MSAFPVTRPVTARIEVPVGIVRVSAGERSEVTVRIEPSDPQSSGGVRAAQDVQVSLEGTTLQITYPDSWKQYLNPFQSGTVEITVELPSGSSVRGKALSLHTNGDLDEVDMALTAGSVRIEAADRLALKVAAGSVDIGHVSTSADIRIASGGLRLESVSGRAELKVTNGTLSVGAADGEITAHGAHGDVVVSRATGRIALTSAHGQVRIDRLDAGVATLKTSFGGIEVGIPEGTAALLDTRTSHGRVRHELAAAEGPGEGESTAEVHASTGMGDILIRRPRT